MWAEPFTIAVADRFISVRAGDAEDTALLREALRAYVVEADTPEVNFTVEFAEGPNNLHLLRWGGCLVARARDLDDILIDLSRHVAGHGTPATRTVRFRGCVIAGGTSAMVVPESHRSFAWRAATTLRSLGVRHVAVPFVDVDIETAAIQEPREVDFASDAVDLLRARRETRTTPTDLPPGPWNHQLRAVVVPWSEHASRAEAVVALVTSGVVETHPDTFAAMLSRHADITAEPWDGLGLDALVSIARTRLVTGE